MPTSFYTHYLAEHKSCKVFIEARTPQLLSPDVAMLGDECLIIDRSTVDLFTPIHSMGAVVTLESTSNFQFAPLMTAPDRTYRMRIEKNGKEVFRGWVTNELYEEEYDQPPYPVSIRATDGLASLEDYQLDVEGLPPAHSKYTALVSLADLIEGCLHRTDLDLPVVYCSTLQADSDGQRDVFKRFAVDRNALYFDDDGVRKAEPALETLSHILSAFGMRVYQDCGRWVVERYTDRIDNAEEIVVLDTKEYPFVDVPTLSISAGYGSQNVNLNVDTYDSIFHTAPTMPMPEMETVKYDLPPYQWYRKKSAAVIKNSTEKGYSLIVPDNDRTATIFCSSPIKLLKGDKLGVSFRVKSKTHTDLTHPGETQNSKRQCYIAVEVFLWNNGIVAEANAYDLQVSKSIFDGAPIGSLLPAPSEFGDFVWAPPVQASTWDYREKLCSNSPWQYRHPVISEKDLMTKGANVSFTIGASSYMPSAMLEGSRIIIVVNSRIRAFEVEGAVVRPAEVDVPRNWDWQFGSLEVNIDRNGEDPIDTLTGALNGGYLREAPEVNLHLRMNSPELPIDYTYRGALFDRQTAKIASGLHLNDVRMPIEQSVLVDNFAQYAKRRDRLSATVQTDKTLSPAAVYTLSTRPGHRYILVGCTTDLIEGEHDIVLEEINQSEIDSTWQA